jgi:DNA polymerase (family 10)
MSIDSDAHAPGHFAFLQYGIAQARRGWASKADIINAWPLERMLKWLKK